MTENLERLVQTAEGQAPSADFVARLRAQIVAETEGSGEGAIARRTTDENSVGEPVLSAPDEDTTDGEITVVLDLETVRQDRGPSRRLQLIGAAAAVAALVFVGVWAFTDDNDRDVSELDMVDTPESPESTDDQGVEGAPLTAGNTFFDAGTFQIDTLGTAFTITVEETRGLLVNENDIVLMTDLTSRNADDRTITFRRTGQLPDPAAPTAEFDAGTSWPAGDLLGWVEAASDDVTATTPTSTTLGGVDALFVELDFPCRGVNCVAGLPTKTPELTMFTAGSRYRLWVVDQGQEDPIVVVVAIDDEGETAWFDEADGILATLEFGEVEPNPVRRPAPGPVDLDVFDGISMSLPSEVVVVEPFAGFARIIPPGIAGDVELLTRPLDVDGVDVTTTDQLVELLEDEAVSLEEVASVGIGGFDARSFEVDSGGSPNIVLKAREADLVRTEFGWESPREGHLWVVEHPERGLLVVSAESLSDPAGVEQLRSWAEALLRSVNFDET